MRTATILALTVLTIGAWAADDAGAAPQQATSLKPQAASYGAEAITIPQMLSYQGKLTDTFGLPVADTLYAVRFRLYAQPTGGTQFWEENQNVRTTGGLFSTLLGTVTPIGSMPDAGALYLGMAVGGGAELSPRLRIASAAYAYLSARAANADLLQGKDTTTLDGRYVNEAQANSVTSTMITNGTIAAADLNQMGAASGQVMKWTGSAWAPRNDSVGGSGGVPDSVPGSFAVTTDLRVYGKGRIGPGNSNAGNAAFVAGEGNTASANYASVSGGADNTAGGTYAHVGGGGENRAAGAYSTVGGGVANYASGGRSTVDGGSDNEAYGLYAAIGGGLVNLAGDAVADTAATVAGGYVNVATGKFATVGGGQRNLACSSWATVGGGYCDSARGQYSTVSGGNRNVASGRSSTVAGGSGNDATGDGALVGGGTSNTASGEGATVGGGDQNQALGFSATVSGGDGNRATASGATIGGGYDNDADSGYTTVCGGNRNHGWGNHATIGGGFGNVTHGDYSVVGGGYSNRTDSANSTVGGGLQNSAKADGATVGGGADNSARALRSTVAGGRDNVVTAAYGSVAGGVGCGVYGQSGFAAGSGSIVDSGHSNSAALNGTTTTASSQLRCGTLSKAGGSFTIDHPLDPQGMILNHYFVESPDMSNIYSGSVVLDAGGRAEVRLPDYFDALNRNARVQLTGVGTREVIYVAEDVAGNRFAVGGPAGAKVYWQVTGDRKDVSAEAIRRMMPVEQPKTGELAGRMLDDDFLSGCMDQLVREGKAAGIDFRTQSGRQQYQEMRRTAEENSK